MTVIQKIEAIKSVMAPPAEPVEVGDDQMWATLTGELGFRLPTDFQKFIRTYGTGGIGNQTDPHPGIMIFNPFAGNPEVRLMTQIPRILSDVAELKRDYPETCPYPLLYEPGGIVPWGFSIDGDQYFWRTEGGQACWTTVVLCRHDAPEEHQIGFVDFLLAIARGELESGGIPAEVRQRELVWFPDKT